MCESSTITHVVAGETLNPHLLYSTSKHTIYLPMLNDTKCHVKNSIRILNESFQKTTTISIYGSKQASGEFST